MLKQRTGFVVQVTTRRRLVGVDRPGEITQRQMVLLAPTLDMATMYALDTCPGDQAIMSFSVSELPVFDIEEEMRHSITKEKDEGNGKEKSN